MQASALSDQSLKRQLSHLILRTSQKDFGWEEWCGLSGSVLWQREDMHVHNYIYKR